MALKFEQKLPLVFSAIFVILTVVGFVLYDSTTALQAAIDREKRTKQMLTALDRVLVLHLDVESSMRRFVIGGSETYLANFGRAQQQVGPLFAELRQLSSGQPAQTAEIDRLRPMIEQNIQDAQKKIDLRKTNGFDSVVYQLAATSDQALSDNIRLSIERLKDSEITSMQARDSALDARFGRTIGILIIGSIAGIAALVIANLTVYGEIRRRRGAELALQDANKGLEERIGERTLELNEANDRLQQIGREREQLLTLEQAARQEAEMANRLRDEFLATASHELRTPINSILGWARLMKSGDLDHVRTTKGIQTIIRNSEVQIRLIQDLMDVARVISGKLEIEFSPIDPASVLNHAAESIRPMADAKSVSLRIAIDPAVIEARLSGDRDRLIQVFTNLLTNAVKFTRSGGSVELSARIEGSLLEVAVKDSGVGISKDFLPLVFERFRQDRTDVSGNGGLGLGLAIVRNIVEIHHGSVSVESDGKDRGSIFTVSLPLAEG